MTNIKPEIIEGRAVIESLQGIAASALIGSALYLPAEKCADVDFAVMLTDGNDAMQWCSALMSHDQTWSACGDYDSDSGTWFSVRRGDLNLMVTHDRAFYDRYLTAMEVCKALRLEKKEHRIAVCRIVRDGWSADSALPFNDGEIPF